MGLNFMYKKLGLAKNPTLTTRFRRKDGSILRATIDDIQARAVLTTEGFRRWQSGEILTTKDINDSTVLAALEGREGIIYDRNPWTSNPWTSNPWTNDAGTNNVNVAICGTVLIGILYAVSRAKNG